MAQVYTIENLHELDLPPSLMKQQGKGDVRWVENVVQHMREDGFLLSGSETIIAGQDSVTLRIIPGKRYTWAHLSTDSIDTQLLSAAGLKKFDPDGAPVSYQEIAAAAGQLLTYAEEHGFPFATVELCRLNLEDTVLSASLCLQLNRFIRFDTLMVLGNSLLSAHYLEIYTGIQSGQPYHESLVRDLDDAGLAVVDCHARRRENRDVTQQFHFNRVTLNAERADLGDSLAEVLARIGQRHSQHLHLNLVGGSPRLLIRRCNVWHSRWRIAAFANAADVADLKVFQCLHLNGGRLGAGAPRSHSKH